MRSRRWWTVLAVVVGLGGIVMSAVAADAVVDNARRQADEEFDRGSSEVAATIEGEVQHLTDLSLTAEAFIRRAPSLSTSELRRWTDEVALYERYPAVLGVSVVEVVADADLDTVGARMTADPPDNSDPPGEPFFLDPPDRAAGYCLQVAGVKRPEIRQRMGRNFCPGATPELMATMRSIDRTMVIPTTAASVSSLSVAIPLYRDRGIPATPEERQAQFIAVLGLTLDPADLLHRAIANYPDLTASLDFRTADEIHEDYRSGSFRTGPVVPGSRHRVVDVGGGWRVSITQPAATFSITKTSDARNLFLAGGLGSLLFAALLYILATGRARALRLVATKTEELSHQALHEPLTGLANRTLLSDRAEQLLARSRRSGTTPSCLFLDLDGFKNINDSLGHEAGDLLLRAVSVRLRGAVREADTIARMGGDEFVVLLDGAILAAAPLLVAERILDVLRQPFEVDGVESVMRVTSSIGIATGVRASADDLLREADVALYEAKAAGRNRVMQFRPDMQEAVQHGIELEFELHSALERDEFRLLYQPIYNIEDLSLIGFEALLRWEHPTFGTVQPDDFIPLLERTGQIVEVGRWVVAEACRQLAAWQRLGTTGTMSVNVSPKEFESGRLVDDVREALAAASLPASALTIQITESSLMRALGTCIEQLVELRAMGVHVAVGDFGSGYSSLASLQHLPVDGLKIDRSLIAAMVDGPEARALVRTIVQLGKDLGLKTLAEGVETLEQMDDLRGDGIDEAQGFLLARPLDAETVERTGFATWGAPEVEAQTGPTSRSILTDTLAPSPSGDPLLL